MKGGPFARIVTASSRLVDFDVIDNQRLWTVIGSSLSQHHSDRPLPFKRVNGSRLEYTQRNRNLNPSLCRNIVDEPPEIQWTAKILIRVRQSNYGKGISGNALVRKTPEKKNVAVKSQLPIAEVHRAKACFPTSLWIGTPRKPQCIWRSVEQVVAHGELSMIEFQV